MSVSMRWRGANSFEKKLSSIPEKLKQNVARAVSDVVSQTHDAAMPLTPLDKGPLRETSEGRVGETVVSRGTQGDNAAHVATVNNMGDSIEGVVAYRTDYAVRVHEIPARNRTTAGTTHKFLELTTTDRREANKKILREAAKLK